MDPFIPWFDALEQRHLRTLTFQEIRRAVQSLSSLYVERRNKIGQGSALDGAGKRAAFACYFAPLHFLLVREIVRALGAGSIAAAEITDLGCGTGIAGAAWALEMTPPPKITGVDRHPWALQEARWTCSWFGFRASFTALDFQKMKLPATAIIVAFALNELEDDARLQLRRRLLGAAERGSPILIVEPIARRSAPWWKEWADPWIAAGGREDEWRFPAQLPPRLALMDKAAGLNHGELTGRSLWLPGRTSITTKMSLPTHLL